MNKISYILKSSNLIYSLYFYIMSSLLKVIGFFVGNNKRLILFNSYGGKKYDDSPKIIYERMIEDSRFNDYELVWALNTPDTITIPGRTKKIKTDSLRYFVTALRARIWITNSSMERGLAFKKNNTICYNTWHGTAIKVLGIDVQKDNKSFRSKINVRADFMLAQSQYDVEIFSHAFQLPVSCFRLTGAPRNDELTKYDVEDVKRIKDKLGISHDKSVLLYAHTLREYSKGNQNEVVLRIPIDMDLWQEKLDNSFIVLFRAHYEVAKHMGTEGYSVFKDVSSYPDLNELMIVSDALISDYSSIFFDYSVMHKPMYCFAYDYEEYKSKRGMYLNLQDEMPCDIHYDEIGLLDDIVLFEERKNTLCNRTLEFQKKYVTEYGNAAEKCCDILANELLAQ